MNHGFAGEQVGADMIMVDNALQTMELVYCELDEGDALIFHSNILHRSEPIYLIIPGGRSSHIIARNLT